MMVDYIPVFWLKDIQDVMRASEKSSEIGGIESFAGENLTAVLPSLFPSFSGAKMTNEILLLSLVIPGEPAAKSNSRRIVRGKGGRFMVIKSKKAMEYSKTFSGKIPEGAKRQFGGRDCPLRLDTVVYYATYRPDLSVELIKDLLQKNKVIKNDRFIREEHSYAFVDRNNPRVELRLYKIPVDRNPPFTLDKSE